MSAADFLESLQIVEANSVHEWAVAHLAEECGQRVDAAAHRAQSGARLLVCSTSEGEAIGFVSARVLLTEAEIFDLCVRAAERRRGVARALLTRLLSELKAEEVREVFLEVRVSNAAAQGLYRGLGFSCVGNRPHYYADGEDAALFRCCFAPAG